MIIGVAMAVTASPRATIMRCVFPLLFTSLTTSSELTAVTVSRQDNGDLVKSIKFTDSSDCDKINAWYNDSAGGCNCRYVGLTISAETKFGCQSYKGRGTL